jgi:hypothetical protein
MKYRFHIIVFILAFLLYGASAGLTIRKQSKAPQYVYLAYAFLHGKLNLIQTPESTYDLILYRGLWYVPGAIMPAILLMPSVAVWGLDTSDVLFGVVFGSINVLLIYNLLGKLILQKNVARRNWLTLLFAAGTVHWWVSSMGSVWFNAQILAVTFMVLYVDATISNKHPWLAGTWLGLAVLSRPSVIFAVMFYMIFIALNKRDWHEFFKKTFLFMPTFASAIIIMLLYNVLRFGNPLDFGYGLVHGAPGLIKTYAQYGGFNLRYIPCNMYVSLLGMPNIIGNSFPNVNTVCSYLEPSKLTFPDPYTLFIPMGMSMFLTTPAILLIFKALSPKPLIVAAWVGLACVLFPLWMYHTTGYSQFGYRYILDFIVFVFILLANGIEEIRWLEKIAILISIIVNAAGMMAMFALSTKMDWLQMWAGILRKIFVLWFFHR